MKLGEVPIGAVIVREGRIIARAFNQVELLKDATAHAEMLALTQARRCRRRLAADRLHALRHQGAVSDVRRRHRAYAAGARRVWRERSERRRGGRRDESAAISHLNHRCEITAGVRLAECRALLQSFFAEQRRRPRKTGKVGPGKI